MSLSLTATLPLTQAIRNPFIVAKQEKGGIIMDLKGIGAKLCVRYVVPYVTKIIKSAISTLSKCLYEKLYNRFKNALESFENALNKAVETTDPKKLKKRILCCRLGLGFFEKINQVLNEVIPNYAAAITQAEEKYSELTGEALEEE